MHACMHACIDRYIHTSMHTYIHTYIHTTATGASYPPHPMGGWEHGTRDRIYIYITMVDSKHPQSPPVFGPSNHLIAAVRNSEDQDELEREERRKRGLYGLSNSEKARRRDGEVSVRYGRIISVMDMG